MKKLILFCFLTPLLLLGCATTMPLQTQEDYVRAQAEMLRFEQARTLSINEIPDLYDVSRLRKGSTVRIQHTQSISGGSYFITKTLRDIKDENGNRIYIIDSTMGDKTSTFDADSPSLRKIISPYENIQPMANFKGLPERSNLPTAILQGAITGGVLGVILNAVDYDRMKGINKEVEEHIRSTRVETKVVDLVPLSPEILHVGSKDILCKVYQVQSLTRQTRAPTRLGVQASFISDKSERIWISGEVPFGIVKAESVQTFHVYTGGSGRVRIATTSASQTMRGSSEVVEFGY